MNDAELLFVRKNALTWVEGDENDGRLTTGSSAQLDYCLDLVEEVDSIFEKRATRRHHPICNCSSSWIDGYASGEIGWGGNTWGFVRPNQRCPICKMVQWWTVDNDEMMSALQEMNT
ncbi:hypothetical protein JWJ90_13285 [Desulfobulbus rhabdoformis]|uniref:hypothetical protein n=1 Tax=Desulfobulbus rhabdoformis TaxID=34032 RepID=UPI0019651620|nr:hypothetical protein [Desulfobulbus rhabdoformis]MBM9615253.1 hypothetical protein [Desulfobulbus rhabdoformis]